MLFIIWKMKINMKEESGFLITNIPLRPRTEGSMRLCVMIFSKKSLFEEYLKKIIKFNRLIVGLCYAKIRG